MNVEDLKNLELFFEERKIDVRKNRSQNIAVQTEVLNKNEVLYILELYQKGMFYDHIEGLKNYHSSFDKIKRPVEKLSVTLFQVLGYNLLGISLWIGFLSDSASELISVPLVIIAFLLFLIGITILVKSK